MNDLESINEYLDDLIDEKIAQWEEDVTIQEVNVIPNPDKIRLEKPHWYRINNVVAVFADMSGSTSVNVKKYRHPKTRGRVYEAFTGALVSIFNLFNVNFIDIQGDGVLGIWDGEEARYLALAATVTFKTYVNRWLADWVKKKTSDEVDIHVHTGMDEYEVFLKYIGLRGDMKAEVWAGEPVPIAAKLCSQAQKNEIIASDRIYQAFKLDEIYLSCGCGGKDGVKSPLWEEIGLDEEKQELLGFEKVWKLESNWCKIHGGEYCNQIINGAK